MPDVDIAQQYIYEREGYRAKAGTSIAIRLNPGKLGALNLRDAVEKYLCGARVPVYYNNKRIGRTYEEVMQSAHEVAGERLYELTDRMKEQFDQSFPAVRGQYPKIAMTVAPLDTEEDHVLEGVSGVLVKYEVRFDKTPEWKVKDQRYIVRGYIGKERETLQATLYSSSVGTVGGYSYEWERMEKNVGEEAMGALAAEFENYSVCPQTEEQLGEVWLPFAEHMSLYEAWRAYHDYQQSVRVHLPLGECGCSDIAILISNYQCEGLTCAYQGIIAGRVTDVYSPDYSCLGVFFLENEWRPVTEVSRFKITEIPLKITVVISGILNKYQMLDGLDFKYNFSDKYKNYSLKEWKEVQIPCLKQWMENSQKTFFAERTQFLMEPLKRRDTDRFHAYMFDYSDYAVLNTYHDVSLQNDYQLVINYEEGQTISFSEKEEIESESALDLFPPMRFCKAASDRSRKYLCCADALLRKGITVDHPFTVWLVNNAALLKQYYQRQFQQIVDCLCLGSAEDVTQE